MLSIFIEYIFKDLFSSNQTGSFLALCLFLFSSLWQIAMQNACVRCEFDWNFCWSRFWRRKSKLAFTSWLQQSVSLEGRLLCISFMSNDMFFIFMRLEWPCIMFFTIWLIVRPIRLSYLQTLSIEIVQTLIIPRRLYSLGLRTYDCHSITWPKSQRFQFWIELVS